jgi:hypothetical protein
VERDSLETGAPDFASLTIGTTLVSGTFKQGAELAKTITVEQIREMTAQADRVIEALDRLGEVLKSA